MGLKEILGSIDLKDLAMGMAVASQGDTAVPDVMKVLEQRRLEQDRKNQQGLTNEFLYDAYNQLSGGSNPVPGILQKERQINAMPETVPQYDTAGVTTPQPVGVTGLDEATTNVSNQAKAQASADFIIEAQEISKKMPNWADGVAYLRNKYRDKPVDSQLVSSALSSLYGKREAQILKGMEIADRQQAREDTAKTKEEDRKSKITTGFKAGEPYMEVAPGQKEEKDEIWTDWGHGQKRNRRTGEIIKVPTAPKNIDYDARELTKQLKLEQLNKIRSDNQQIENRMVPTDKVEYNNAMNAIKQLEVAKAVNPFADDTKIDEALNKYNAKINGLVKKYDKSPEVQEKSADPNYLKGVIFLKGAKSRDEAIKKIQSMSNSGWSKDQLYKAAKEAGLE
jgi:hypothetical protein